MTSPLEHPQPHDKHAERAVLGEVLRQGHVPPAVAALMTPGDLYGPAHQAVAEVMWDLTSRAEPYDPIRVRNELLRRGERGQVTDGGWLVDLLGDAQPMAAHHARTVRDLAVRRRLVEASLRGLQLAAAPDADPYDSAASMSVTTAALAERDEAPRAVPLVTVEEFLRGTDEYDWLVPGLLERGDRLLLVGGEGSGKSVLLRQLAVCAAAGSHPFTGRRHDPLRVLLVDLENGPRLLRRSLRRMVEHSITIGRPARLHIESRPSGIDLARPDDERWLTGLCETAQPQVLVIGPLYRMHAGDMREEESARHMTQVLDGIRARHGCALLMETHAPHGQGLGQRALRPIGSSLFLRWPEFGYGIRSATDGEGVWDVQAWRGPRDEREWPRQLMRGSVAEWPWIDYNEGRGVRQAWREIEEGSA